MNTTQSEAEIKHFITRQYDLLSREYDAEVERTSLLVSNCSQKLLERKGLAVGSLGVVSVSIGLGGKSLLELERPSAYHTSPIFPPHTLRPGDLARITEYSSGNIKTKKPSKTKNPTPKDNLRGCIEGVVYKVSDTRLVIAADPPSNEELDLPERCCIIKLANTITHTRMKQAIERLERMFLSHGNQNSSHGEVKSPNHLHRVLMGLAPPSQLDRQGEPELFFDSKLNPSQIAAVKFALASPEVACIHGPPGTGKTRVLVEIIRQLVYSSQGTILGIPTSNEEAQIKRDIKILVCGASNLAVDNLLERLCAPIPSPKPADEVSGSNVADIKLYSPIMLTRLGHPARVMASLYPHTLDYQSEESEEAALAKDVKSELEDLLASLSGKVGKGNASGSKAAKSDKSRTTSKNGQRLKGQARREAWMNVKELRKEYRKREEGVVRAVLSKAQVILATCHGAGSGQLQRMEFDVVIIDEATQALEAVCWIPILKAKKLVLAGDPMQLGPTIISEGNRRRVKKKDANAENTCKVATDAPASSGAESLTSANSDRSFTKNNDTQVFDQQNSSAGEKAPTSAPLSRLHPPKSLSTTLFERLESMYGNKIIKMLNVQYRMNTKVASFPSKTLYRSRLQSHSANASGLLLHLPNVEDKDENEDVLGPGTEIVFLDTAGAEFWERSEHDPAISKNSDDGGSLCNENEAQLVKQWVLRLLETGLLSSQIAIITPYQAQCQLLTSLIGDLGIEIGTADGMQGRENEAIVISLVRSNPNGDVGFLKEKRRLNVAMTRAKKHLCVIGDSSTVRRGGKYLSKWMDWLEREADVRFAGDI